MAEEQDKFMQAAEAKVFDLKHRQTIRHNMKKYDDAVTLGKHQFINHEQTRDRISFIKHQVINHLDHYLMEFEERFLARGGKIIWALDGAEALAAIEQIMSERQAKLVVKSKSMTTEEIHLNHFLEQRNIECVESDLGEWIVQMAGQTPYHIVTPAMHMSKEDINALFVEKLKTAPTNDPQELTMTARRLLREIYTTADIGITGGNFLVADMGAVCITENEGNARLTATFPKTLISVVGIEKLIPSMEDLSLFWPMLATSGTGQQVTVYNTMLMGPKQRGEVDGPEEMFLILLDNGRTELLADPEKRDALKCIRCGACLNACPVYKNIGGHTYETPYMGPIGSIIEPHYLGMGEFKHLSYASSLCGACTSVCPVRIDIAQILLLNRREAVSRGYYNKLERQGFKIWQWAMKHRWTMNVGGGKLKRTSAKLALAGAWGKHRSSLPFADKTFNELWKERRG